MDGWTSIEQFKFWCQKIIPLVYDDSLSYYEVLCKLKSKVNEVIEHVNMVPDMIKQEIQDYINSGEIEQLIQNTINQIASTLAVNVLYPPEGVTAAKGDGVTDDSQAFTEILAWATVNEKCVYVPQGNYIVGPIVIPSGVCLYGACAQNTTLSFKAGSAGSFVTLNDGAEIRGITVDGVLANKTEDVVGVESLGSGSVSFCRVEGCTAGVKVSGDEGLEIFATSFGLCSRYHIQGVGRFNGQKLKLGDLNPQTGVTSVLVSGDESVVQVDESPSFTSAMNLMGNDCKVEFASETNGVVNAGSGNSVVNGVSTKEDSYARMLNAPVTLTEGSELNVDTNNPIKYKTPSDLSSVFKSIPFTDGTTVYDVLVANNLTDLIHGINFKSIYEFGAKGDGVSDDTAAFRSALLSNEIVFVNPGSYKISSNLIQENDVYNTTFIIGGEVTYTSANPLELPTSYGSIVRSTYTNENPYKDYQVGIYDATSGGTRGNVIATKFIHSILRNDINNFVWGLVSQVDIDGSITNTSENVGVYSQIKSTEADVGMWAFCADVQNDTTSGNPTTSKIGMEMTYRSAESDNNNMRAIIHEAHNITPGATGSQVYTYILMSGTNPLSGPKTHAKYGISIVNENFDRFIGIGPQGNVTCSIFIDLTNLRCINSGIKLAENPLQFNSWNASEIDGQLKFTFPNSGRDIKFMSDGFQNGNSILKDVTEGATIGAQSTLAIPVVFNGTTYYLPLYNGT